jgi:hypothetical protein
MTVSVQLAPEAARALRSHSVPGEAVQSLLKLLDQFGVRLKPAMPGADHPSLMTWFVIEALDAPSAERIAETLRRHPSVRSAFCKPPEEPAGK